MFLLCGFAVDFNFLPQIRKCLRQETGSQIRKPKILSSQSADLRTDLQKCPALVTGGVIFRNKIAILTPF